MHALGARDYGHARPVAKRLSDAEKAARRIEVFDRICAKHGYTPSLIAQLPPDRLGELVSAEGFPVVSPAALSPLLDEYLTARANGNRN